MKRFWLFIISVVLLFGSVQRPWAADPHELLSLSEAEILIYLMPVSKELRKQGFDVGWELEKTPSGSDSFHFWVYNAKRKCQGCSVTIGSFAVNKNTAEIENIDLGKVVTNKEIRGVQAILRRAHHPGLNHSN
jgi:hypothetical protein